MSLDLEQVAAQIGPLTRAAHDDQQRHSQRLSQAIEVIRSLAGEPQAMGERIRADRSGHSLAIPVEPLDLRKGAAKPDALSYCVGAVDGSHTEVERDSPAAIYVINLGWCVVPYTPGYPPSLGNTPSSAMLPSASSHQADDWEAEAPAILPGLQRAVREFALLAQLATDIPADLPTILLVDGNLVLWNLTRLDKRSRWWQDLAKGPEGVFTSLDKLQRLAADRPRLVIAGYISYPNHRQVLRSLQVAAESVNTEAMDVGGDRYLFQHYLSPGQRSALFQTFLYPRQLRAETDYAAKGHDIHFFYLHTGAEVARVEVPQWCAQDPQRLDLLHQALLDQCSRGQGYPLALAEAHEQAMITEADRAAFQRLLEDALWAEGIGAVASAKNLSKRGRWLT